MDHQLQIVDSRLREIARDDCEVNGWRFLVNDWMFDYWDYFEEEDEGNVDDGIIHEDEGIGEERALQRHATVEALEVSFRQTTVCVLTSAVRIVARNTYHLCGSCYIHYVDHYTVLEMDHTHIMEHWVLSAGRAVNVERSCSACQLSLMQLICTRACLICNNSH